MIAPLRTLLALAMLGAVLAPARQLPAQEEPPSAAAPDEEDFTLTDAVGADGRSIWDVLGENLRVNVDVVTRAGFSVRRKEPESLVAVGLDIIKVFSDSQGDIGTLLLQPYVVRRDNAQPRPIEVNGDDSFVIELHDFYFNLTRFGHGQTNLKIGHFAVPFGLEPLTAPHFTLRQLIPRMNAGFKKDWGLSLNGTFPEFDYEVSLTQGTGVDFTGRDRDPFLVAGRIGTPTQANRVLGLSALYGEVIDEHGTHRVDHNDPRGEFREEGEFVRRLRVGADYTQIVGQYTFRAEVSGGRDFEQSVVNTLAEVAWTSRDERVTAYLQGLYLGQDGHLGWDEDVRTRLGVLWSFHNQWSLSAQWVHDFLTYADNRAGVHLNEDTLGLQLRWTF